MSSMYKRFRSPEVVGIGRSSVRAEFLKGETEICLRSVRDPMTPRSAHVLARAYRNKLYILLLRPTLSAMLFYIALRSYFHQS